MLVSSPHLHPWLQGLHWITLSGIVVNRIFVITVLMRLSYVDNGFCGATFSTMGVCKSVPQANLVDSLCTWSADKGCTYSASVNYSFTSLTCLALTVLLLSIPLDGVYQYFIDHIECLTRANLHSVLEKRSLSSVEINTKRSDALSESQLHVSPLSRSQELEELISTAHHAIHCPGKGNLFNLIGILLDSSQSLGAPIYKKHSIQWKAWLLDRLELSHLKSLAISAAMRGLGSVNEMNAYLIRSFLIYSLDSKLSQAILERLFLKKMVRSAKTSRSQSRRVYLPIAFVVVYSILVMASTYYLGLYLPSSIQFFWLAMVTAIPLISNIIITPIALAIQYFMVPFYARKELLAVLHSLKEQCSGASDNPSMPTRSHALLRSFSPACRAAKGFPDLPAAKMLLALGDFKTPESAEAAQEDDQRVIRKYFIRTFHTSIALSCSLPDCVHDKAAEFCSIGLLAITTLVLNLFVTFTPLPILIVILLGLAGIVLVYLSCHFGLPCKIRIRPAVGGQHREERFDGLDS